MSATTGETWAVVDADGVIHEARVREPATGGRWRVVEVDGGRYEVSPDYTPRAPVALVVAQFTPWQGVEVLAHTNRADVRLWPAASQIVADEKLLRDDVTAALGRASLDGRVRVEMTSGRNPKHTVVFMLCARERNDVFVWSAAVEGPRG